MCLREGFSKDDFLGKKGNSWFMVKKFVIGRCKLRFHIYFRKGEPSLNIQWEPENCGIGRRLLDLIHDLNSSVNIKHSSAVYTTTCKTVCFEKTFKDWFNVVILFQSLLALTVSPDKFCEGMMCTFYRDICKDIPPPLPSL